MPQLKNCKENLMSLATVHKRITKLMGNRFEIFVTCDDEELANEMIDAAIGEISRIEKLFTTFNDYSQTNLINKYAGIKSVKVDREVLDLIDRSLRISDLTQGAFDISYGSIDKSLWNFETNMTALPDPHVAKHLVRLINYRNIALDKKNCTVYLKEKGMRIGFGGIGKGYAAERAKVVMKEKGAKGGIVNASGDMTTWGYKPNGMPWTIGIADPNLKNHLLSYLDMTDMAIATSGNYEKFAIIDGKKYSHTINPKTGYPVSGIKSTTVICPNAEIADAMATPITVMGIETGLDLINQMKDIACIIIDDNDRIFTSKNIQLA
ncbi:MAG: FAD:protein transferase [Chitinophagaceae bacterium]|nr:FAD:protein transferase [Chitinophagaceae bacterium]